MLYKLISERYCVFLSCIYVFMQLLIHTSEVLHLLFFSKYSSLKSHLQFTLWQCRRYLPLADLWTGITESSTCKHMMNGTAPTYKSNIFGPWCPHCFILHSVKGKVIMLSCPMAGSGNYYRV